MQPVKLIVPGSFWDVQIYAGQLHLFGLNGELTSVNWKSAVNSVGIPHDLAVVAHIAFVNGSLFYEEGARVLAHDQQIRSLILEKFHRLSAHELVLDDLCKHAQITDNPFPFPHTDSDVHYRKLFVGSSEGLYSASVYSSKWGSSDMQDLRKWDGPVFDLSASQKSVALAAGNEGLFESSLGEKATPLEPKKLVANECTLCDWAFYSIYGSTHNHPGFLASFERVKEDENVGGRYVRKFDRVISSSELFHSDSYGSFSWATADKFYRYRDGIIEVLRYNPRTKNEEQKFDFLGNIEIETWKGNIVSAQVAPFGTVLEFDNALIIVASNGDTQTIVGEPTNWRVYNKSENYKNQLHIIYEDRLEIWSFDHDYFVDQDTKLAGIAV